MRKFFKFKNLKAGLIFWFLFASVTPLLIVIGVIYYQRVQVIHAAEYDKLRAIRDLKVKDINNWFDERERDVLNIAGDEEIKSLEWISKVENANAEEIDRITIGRDLLKRFQNHDNTYNELFLLSPVTGQIVLSTEESHEGKEDKSDKVYFTETLRTGELHIQDIYFSREMNAPSMTFSVPVFGLGESHARIVAVLVARVDLESSLYDMLLDRSGMGQTGETLIVNKDAIAINELRWYERAPLKLKIDAEPAFEAMVGNTGVAETKDYRNERVLAAYTHIPRIGWGFVAKRDLTEIFAGVQVMFRQFLMILATSIVAILILALWLSDRISRPVIYMSKVAGRIEGGDLSSRAEVVRSDELGHLARAINNMAATLEERINVQAAAAEISDLIVTVKTLKEFAHGIVEKLVPATGSVLGVFYLHAEQSGKFEHFASIGANSELLEPFDADISEGEFGMVLATRSVSHIKGISSETAFKFKTVSGTLIPKEIMSIPVVVDGQVAAIISLASVTGYTRGQLETINQSRAALNTGFSNLLANTRTEMLAEKLQASNHELQAVNQELQSQSEELQSQARELKGQTAELEAQRQQVEEADRLKSEFLSNMSHELRTPLNSIMALSDLMMSNSPTDNLQDYTEHLEIINRNGGHLLNLINDILDLSKIEAGRMELILSDFESRVVIERVIETVRPTVMNKNLELKVDLQDVPRMYSDESRLNQILLNMLSNAVKFTESGTVEVTVSQTEGKVSLAVRDTGIGISPEDQAHIFEQFRQVDGSSTRKYEGTGLGLSISQRLANLLGGEISLESTPGEGSVFTLVVPVSYEAAHDLPTEVITTDIRLEAAPAKGGARHRTILVIDDEPDVCEILREYLEGAGYGVEVAHTGAEGLRKARELKPFAITLDVMMPEMDGWETIKKLKTDAGTRDIPVLIVSVSEDLATGMALGAVGYIVKPIDKSVLLSELEKIAISRTVKRVLVVDDDPVHRQVMVKILTDVEYEVESAAGGKEALNMARQNPPDAMVLDLMMPEMDGFQVLDEIRQLPEICDLPVIVVTAKDLTGNERAQLQGSTRRIIAKGSMDRDLLLEELKASLAKLEQDQVGQTVQREKPLILVVDDNQTAALQVRTALEGAGLSVSEARGGSEALESFKTEIPDLMVLDLMMPEVDGFQVLEQIRSSSVTASVPVLVLTAKELSSSDLVRLKYNNIRQLIQKGSVSKEQLVKTVGGILGRDLISPARAKPGAKKKKEVPRSASPVTGGEILIVEDNPDNMFSLTSILDKMGKKYIMANDGEQGVEIARKVRPALILMDIQLPGLNGMEATRQIKDDPALAGVIVVALTAKAMLGDREEILAAGCDDYISKPFTRKDIESTVRKWIG